MPLKTFSLNLDEEIVKDIRKTLDKSNADNFSRYVRNAIKEKFNREQKEK